MASTFGGKYIKKIMEMDRICTEETRQQPHQTSSETQRGRDKEEGQEYMKRSQKEYICHQIEKMAQD